MSTHIRYNTDMENRHFQGIQEGEKILAEVYPHPFPIVMRILIYLVLVIFFVGILVSVGSQFPQTKSALTFLSLILSVLALIFLSWDLYAKLSGTKTFITDRRIIRFEMLSPVYTAKRALFWSETLKAKGYSTNLIYRLSGIGSMTIESQAAEAESITVDNIAYYEDLANYIDKIVYHAKNDPAGLTAIRPFSFKPAVKRS